MALLGGLGRPQTLVVAHLVNFGEIREATSIPTTALAMARFQAAIVAATTDWVEAGPLSRTVMALLLQSRVEGIDTAIAESLAQYRFVDPFSGTGSIDLHAITVSVGLERLGSLEELFARVYKQLADASSEARVPLPIGRAGEWCRDLIDATG